MFKVLRYNLRRWSVLLLMCSFAGSTGAQEMEPRVYSNAPIGMNFLLLGYGHSDGALLFDSSIPIQGASAVVDIAVMAYAHSFDFQGKSARFGIVMPYAGLDANGFLDGAYRERNVSGFADPTFVFSVNFSGAPALTLDEFQTYTQDTIVGATIKITAPLGQYDEEKLLNIGTNRWTFKPELGISQAMGDWIVEGAAAIAFYTDNTESFAGQKLEQAPIYSAQGHVVYKFSRGLWAAADATYYTGGTSTVNGIENDNELDNWRFGLTLAITVNKYNAIKLAANTGVSTRTGTDFDAYLLAWQYRWGGGL